MPAIPPFIRELLWEQFAALLPQPLCTWTAAMTIRRCATT
jgi:hypothetical protein